jgi:hypothetical protein
MYRKRLKTLKIGLKNAFSELAECGRYPHRKPNLSLRHSPSASDRAVLVVNGFKQLDFPILLAKVEDVVGKFLTVFLKPFFEDSRAAF